MNDVRLYRRPWGFQLHEVRQAVHLWHGELDSVVPPLHSRFLCARLPNAQLDIVPLEGHFSLPLQNMQTILQALRQTPTHPLRRNVPVFPADAAPAPSGPHRPPG